jgi:hypothetical protein
MGDAASEVYLDVRGDVTPAIIRPASRRLAWWIGGRWLALVDILLVLAVGWLWSQEGFSTLVVLSAAFAGAALIVLALMLCARPRARRNSALSDGKMHFLAREDGYFVEGPFGEQTFRWGIYKKAYVDKRFIYLLLSNSVAQVIPLQLVPDPEPLLQHLRKLGLLRRTPRAFILF